jgi:hypothetical protein
MLDLKKATFKEVRYTKTGLKYFIHHFNCLKCQIDISTQHGYHKKHTGLCASCSQKKQPFQSAYTQMLGAHRRKGWVDVMSYDEFIAFCTMTDCHYCDTEIRRSTKRGELGYRGYFLDRKNNDKGYLYSNCVPCCWECNQAKGNRYTYQEFIAISDLIKQMRSIK